MKRFLREELSFWGTKLVMTSNKKCSIIYVICALSCHKENENEEKA